MRYKKITSPSNPLIRELLKEKKEREGNRLIIEGHRVFEMALASGAHIGRVFFTENYRSKNEDFLRQAAKYAPELMETTEQILSRIAETETPQGIVAVVSYKRHVLRELSLTPNPLIVVCDGIQDPGNVGAIIRTADAANADILIILPGTCDPLMPKAVRATAGSIFNIPVVTSGPEQLVEWLRKKSIGIVVAEAHASRTIYDADLRKPVALVFGNEAAGPSDYLKRNSDMDVSIPIPGKAESLNVAASAAISLFEAVRQRRGRSL
jgi:TrmH family RNA methyltransferase